MVNEKENNEGKEKTDTGENTGKGDKSEAVKETERLNSESEELEKARARNDAVMARKAQGGDIDSGQVKEPTKEETPKEYNDRIEKELSEGKHDD